MTARAQYTPGPALEAQIRKGGEQWTLILVRGLPHPPERVWEALTDPAYLREWAPFDADRNLGREGATATLTTIGAPEPHVTETRVKRADPPSALEYNWGGGEVRWELERTEQGTRLTLSADFDRRWIAMGATGWQICLDVLDRLLSGTPIGRIVGPEAMAVDGFQRLHTEYAEKFGVDLPSW